MKQKSKTNRPIYVTSINEDKFENIQDLVSRPLAFLLLFFAMGIFGSILLLLVCVL